MRYYVLCLLFVFLFACKPQFYTPSSEVNKYVDDFFQAARNRNIELPKKKIDIRWGEMENHQFGKCLPRKKIIMLNEKAWDKKDSHQRRSLIFHELGHCFLGRTAHKDSLLPRGECASLLKSEKANCVCNLYEKNWWEYYVDELFDENTGPPEWYRDYVQLDTIEMKRTLLIDTTFIKSLSVDVDKTIFSGRFLGEVEIFETYQEDAACYFRVGRNSIVPVQNNILNIYRANLNRTDKAYFHSGTYEGEILQRILIYYDREFWRFYVNDRLVYKMGDEFWQVEKGRDQTILANLPIEVYAWGKNRISKQTMALSGRVKIFEIQ